MVNRYKLFPISILFLKYIHRRVLRDDPSKSSMHNRQGLNMKMLIEVLVDWRLWPLYILGLLHMSGFVALSLVIRR
jgi:hypothetical protein